MSVKKTRGEKFSQLDGFYLEKVSYKNTISSVNIFYQPRTSRQSNNDSVVIMLQEIKDSNAALARSMDRVEQSAMRDVTPLNPRCHTHVPLSHSSHICSPTVNPNHVDVADPAGDLLNLTGSGQDRGQATVSSHTHIHQYHLRSNQLHGLQSVYIQPQLNLQTQCDTVIPNLQNLRTNPTFFVL